jgi:hypothetical protein
VPKRVPIMGGAIQSIGMNHEHPAGGTAVIAQALLLAVIQKRWPPRYQGRNKGASRAPTPVAETGSRRDSWAAFFAEIHRNLAGQPVLINQICEQNQWDTAKNPSFAP